MPTIAYIEKKFQKATKTVIMQAERILLEYEAQGFTGITLRGLYYQFIGRNLFPEDRKFRNIPGTKKWVRDPNGTKNAPQNYKWLGSIINDARLAGWIDWGLMEDITRKIEDKSSWTSPKSIMRAVLSSYHLNRWDSQEYRPEIWIEKDALLGIIKPICEELDVPYFSCRGYNSQSSMWQAGQRLIEYMAGGHIPYIFHLGDHDPSGVQMTDDIMNRLELYLGHEGYGMEDDWKFKRIALSMEQVKERDLPSDPAKPSDSRSAKYIEDYGSEAWELDALSPSDITDLIRDHIEEITDFDLLEEIEEREKDHLKLMKKAINNMDIDSEED